MGENREVEELIWCNAMKPGALRSLVICKKCEFHQNIIELSPEQNGRPPQNAVRCNLPRKVDVLYRLIEKE